MGGERGGLWGLKSHHRISNSSLPSRRGFRQAVRISCTVWQQLYLPSPGQMSNVYVLVVPLKDRRPCMQHALGMQAELDSSAAMTPPTVALELGGLE